jgi:beta-phosphoglucomutase-like phosphatase (HAD superfamily)
MLWRRARCEFSSGVDVRHRQYRYQLAPKASRGDDYSAKYTNERSPRTEIGSDYGEGFISLHGQLDVNSLNDNLQVRGAERMKYSMHPDQAFGLIYDFEVFSDLDRCRTKAWSIVARNRGLQGVAQHTNIRDMMAERVIMEVFRWTSDILQARALAFDFHEAFVQCVVEDATIHEHALAWLNLAADLYKIPCALVSRLDRKTVISVLEKYRIESKFQSVVVAEDDLETMAQQYLASSIRICRAPKQCIVFCTSTSSIVAAHNCTMKAVGIIGRCTAPQLANADMTVATFSELSIFNIRRLFADGDSWMHLKKERDDSSDDEQKRKTRNATLPEE